jgi:hypothetical protein
MHDRCDMYIKGLISKDELVGAAPDAVIQDEYLPVLDQFRDHPNGDRHTEHRLGFDDEWYLCGGISPKAWCVGVLDAVRCENKILHIAEWKSGSPKETHGDQRKMYALLGLRKWVFVDEVRVTTYYLEGKGEPQRLVVKPTAEEKLRALWGERVAQMQRDQICAPRPGMHCRWCDYSKDKGGPCRVG